MRQWFARSLAVLAVALTGARPVPEGSAALTFVPWKVVRPGTPPVSAPLMLFWVPASREELRRSPLLTSEPLARYAAQCVAMLVIRPDDYAMAETLDVKGKLPAAILADGDGRVLVRLETDSGELPPEEVEEMVGDVLDSRGEAADALLDAAKEKAASGETEAAVAIYRKVWEQRCTCPRQARDARRALKKLGRR
jgi:hypothetical protein